ncbi:hypothetical protein ACFXPN_20035 [Streptomyces griseorubiginosus]
MIYVAVVPGLLAGITGWRHPDPGTRAWCRAFAAGVAVSGLIMWSQR